MSISTNSAQNNTITVKAHREQLNTTVPNGPEKHMILNQCKLRKEYIQMMQNTKVLISKDAFLLGFTVATKPFCQECLG